jgi:hypothetical protein
MTFLAILEILTILSLGVLLMRAYVKLEEAEYRLTIQVRENALLQLPAEWPGSTFDSGVTAEDR